MILGLINFACSSFVWSAEYRIIAAHAGDDFGGPADFLMISHGFQQLRHS
jgi:hypothetical protein